MKRTLKAFVAAAACLIIGSMSAPAQQPPADSSAQRASRDWGTMVGTMSHVEESLRSLVADYQRLQMENVKLQEELKAANEKAKATPAK